MFRYISIVCLLQVMLVAFGFLALFITLSAEGYPHDPPFMASLGRVVWSSLTLLLRRHGLDLLFVPVVWAVFTSLSGTRPVIFSQDAWLSIGVGICMAIIALFLYACIHRYAVVPN
jgi:hypothetical protein